MKYHYDIDHIITLAAEGHDKQYSSYAVLVHSFRFEDDHWAPHIRERVRLYGQWWISEHTRKKYWGI